MPHRRRLYGSILPGLLSFFAPWIQASTALASGAWLPLELGNRWEYSGVTSHQTETITGTIILRGRTVYVKSYLEGEDAGLDNYWLSDGDGGVLLAGFTAADGGFGVAYEPPIRMIVGSPSLGLTWSTHTTAYSQSDSALWTFDIHFGVLEDTTLDVPAGLFHCYGVGQTLVGSFSTRAPKPFLSLDGRTITSPTERSAGVPEATDWYSENVGVVQYLSSDRYQLASFTNEPTRVTTTSWARLKRLFR